MSPVFLLRANNHQAFTVSFCPKKSVPVCLCRWLTYTVNEKTAQSLTALSALPVEPGSILSTLIVAYKIAYSSGSRGWSPFWEKAVVHGHQTSRGRKKWQCWPPFSSLLPSKWADIGYGVCGDWDCAGQENCMSVLPLLQTWECLLTHIRSHQFIWRV